MRELNEAERRCVPAMRSTPWGDVLGARRVFGGVELALWDARARTEGVSLALLLGGRVRDEIALTEYFSYRLAGPAEQGESTPVEVARYCAQMVEEHAADGFEGKVATVALSEEVAMVREVRSAIGPDRMLRLDANGAWTVATARDALRRLEPFAIHYYEDPVEQPAELAQLRAATRASFSTHVVDLPSAVRLGAPDCIVTNLNEHGGVRRTVEFIAACRAHDVAFRFHSGETGIASAAYLQVSAAVEHVREPSQTLFRWYADDVIEGGPFVPHGGVVPVPDGPGLGVELDREALRRGHERYRAEGAFPSGRCRRLRRLVPPLLSRRRAGAWRPRAYGRNPTSVPIEVAMPVEPFMPFPLRRAFAFAALAAAVAVAVAIAPASAGSKKIGELPKGPTTRIDVAKGGLVALALPRPDESTGLVWRVARKVDDRVLEQVSEADVEDTVVLVFRAVGRGDGVVKVAQTKGDSSSKAVKAQTYKVHVR